MKTTQKKERSTSATMVFSTTRTPLNIQLQTPGSKRSRRSDEELCLPCDSHTDAAGSPSSRSARSATSSATVDIDCSPQSGHVLGCCVT